jgi:phage terminase large subunit-like protein
MAKPARRRQQRRPTELVSDAVIEFCETYLRIPEGKFAGKPLKLREWQKGIIRATYDEATRRVIISFGRKNGKSALAAMLLLVHLVGPAARKNSQIYSAALSREQAALVFRLAAQMIRQSPELNELVTIRESRKELFCGLTGVTYRALSADATTAFGLSPVLIVHDELGQVSGPRHSLYEALETATGAQESPLSIVISTQAASDADLLSTLIDDAQAGHDPRTKLFLYSADKEADPFSEEAIKQANPAFGDFLDATEVLAMAADAKRMPSREAEFRNFILNQRVEAVNPFVTEQVWKANAGTEIGWDTVYAGLDLSETSDLTALVLVSPVGQTWGVRSTFWLPAEGLEDRARKDHVPYDVWHKQGHLHTTPGRSVEYEYVAKHIATLFETMNIRKVAFDRWNMKHLRPWLVKAGLSDSTIAERFVDFGQGFASMSPALRNLESLLLAEKLRHAMQPVLLMCARNAVVKTDEAGNRKLDKRRSRGRIDGMVALAMACAVGSAEHHEKPVYPIDLEKILING